MIPPRGVIIQSKKRDWFTTRDLQIAFLAARLCLTEPQLLILRSLVHSFAQGYDKLYPSNTTSDPQSQEQPMVTSTVAVGPGHTLSATWLKKYLIHLRLTKKIVSAANNTTTVDSSHGNSSTTPAVTTTTTTDPITVNNAKDTKSSSSAAAIANSTASPLPWKEWLGKKLQSEVKRDSIKPKEFLKALEGILIEYIIYYISMYIPFYVIYMYIIPFIYNFINYTYTYF